MTEIEERQVRALNYIIGDKPFVSTTMEGRFVQIAYRVLPGTKRGEWTFLRAVWLFARVAWRELS